MEETKKRVRRSKDEVVADKIAKLDADITKYREKIAEAERKKEEILNPSVDLKDITAKIKELDLPLDEVMKAVDKIAKKQEQGE